MTPEQMLDMARNMRDKNVAPLDVYILCTADDGSWMVPVPHDNSSKWPSGVDEDGNDCKMAPVQPVRLATQRSAQSETELE